MSVELKKQAEKSLKYATTGHKSVFGFFQHGGNNEDNYETAAEDYKKAAESFNKPVKDPESKREAAELFEKAAEIYSQHTSGHQFSAVQCYSEAFNCWRIVGNVERAKAAGEREADACLENGYSNKMKAAKALELIGDLLEEQADIWPGNSKDTEAQGSERRREAAEMYERAGDRVVDDGKTSNAMTPYKKAANIYALCEDYQKAIDIFENSARLCMKTDSLKFSIKELLFRAGLCHLATRDTITIHRALESYQALDRNFAEGREFQLLNNLVHAMEENDADGFTDHSANFDRIYPMDNWKTAILRRVKDGIGQETEEFY